MNSVKRVNELKSGEHLSVQLVEDGYIVTAFATEVKGNRYHFLMVEGFYGNCEQGFEGFDEQGVYEYLDYAKNLATDTQELDEIEELIVVEEEERKLIGYQVLDVNADIPDGLFSFQVFRSEQDAEDFIEERGLKECTIHEIYDGDIEEPSFLGRKQRTLGKNEYVMVYDNSEGYFPAVIEAEQGAEYEDDEIDVVPIKKGFADCDNRRLALSRDIYQYAEGKNCPRCGGPLCIEHHDGIDYPYFCPSCDEHFYGIEVQ